jgi:hypothetical protein
MSGKRTRNVLEVPATSAEPAAMTGVAEAPEPTLTLDEASMQHEGEWVLMRIAEYDEQLRTHRGYVLWHSPSRKAISQQVKRAHEEDPKVHVAVILGGTRRVTAEELSASLARAATEEYVNARW